MLRIAMFTFAMDAAMFKFLETKLRSTTDFPRGGSFKCYLFYLFFLIIYFSFKNISFICNICNNRIF